MNERIGQIKIYLNKFNPNKLELNKISHVSVKEINRGGYNINYLVEASGHKFVFRFNLDKYLDVDNQITHEYQVLKYLEHSRIAPQVYFIDISRNHFENDILVEEYIEHVKLEFGNEFLKEFGKLIKKLHSVPLSNEKWLIRNNEPLKNQWEFIKGKVDFIKFSGYNQNFVNYIENYFPIVNEYVEQQTHLFFEKDLCLNHRDLVIENVLQTEDGLKLIDWQSVMADDPSFDLAFFLSDVAIKWNLGRSLTESEKQVFIESYGVEKDLMERIKVRLPMIYLELYVWIAYRAAYLRDKLAKKQVNEEDREFIQKRIKTYESLLVKNRIKKDLQFSI